MLQRDGDAARQALLRSRHAALPADAVPGADPRTQPQRRRHSDCAVHTGELQPALPHSPTCVPL